MAKGWYFHAPLECFSSCSPRSPWLTQRWRGLCNCLQSLKSLLLCSKKEFQSHFYLIQIVHSNKKHSLVTTSVNYRRPVPWALLQAIWHCFHVLSPKIWKTFQFWFLKKIKNKTISKPREAFPLCSPQPTADRPALVWSSTICSSWPQNCPDEQTKRSPPNPEVKGATEMCNYFLWELQRIILKG